MSRGGKILLVDDEKDTIAALKLGLEQNDYDVDAFTSSTEALSKFEAGLHDLLILDVRMPGLSGFRLFKAIRAKDESIKVLFMTSFEPRNDEWEKSFSSFEEFRFIRKPVKLPHLVNAISQIKTNDSRWTRP
jgi:DNA-binding response OmpR family regulator